MIVTRQLELHGTPRAQAVGSNSTEVVSVRCKIASIGRQSYCRQNALGAHPALPPIFVDKRAEGCGVGHSVEGENETGDGTDRVQDVVVRRVMVDSGMSVSIFFGSLDKW